MTLTRYLIGLCLLGVSIGSVVLGASAWRRRFLPNFIGPPGVLANIVLSLSAVVVVSELLGSIGLFRLLPVSVSLTGVGALAWRLARGTDGDRTGRDREAEPPAPVSPSGRAGRLGSLTAIAVVALIIGTWSSRVIDALRHGMATADTLWYHLPVAANFVQDGWISELHVYGRSYITYFPSTSELLHALGIMSLGSDVLSTLLNIGWLALALFAGWCIGRPFGVAPITLFGSALVLATPQLLVDDAGSALNDVVGIALLLAAIALLVHAMKPNEARALRAAELACVGLAAGLALGTKYTLIAPVGVLMIGAIVVGVRRHEVVRRGALLLGVVALTGGYWYLRNLFAVGNPLPTLSIGVGPVRLPTEPIEGTASVSKYLFDGTAWSKFFLPGLADAYGPAWWALMGAALIGLGLGAALGPGRVVRMLAVVGLISFVVYLFTPQVLGPPGSTVPRFFAPNVRYSAIALTIGLVVLPLALTRFGDWALRLVVAVYACIIFATQFGRGVWERKTTMFAPPLREDSSMVVGAAIGVAVFAIAIAVVSRGRAPEPRTFRSRAGIASVAFMVLVLAAGLFGVNQFYLDRRYQKTQPLVAINRWAQSVRDQRIAAVNLTLTYPLFGEDLSNHVEHVLAATIADPSLEIEGCRAWRRQVNRSRFSHVVVASHGFPFAPRNPPPSLIDRWTRSDPAAHLLSEDVFFGARAWLYRIDGDLDPAGCTFAVRTTEGQPKQSP